MTAVQLLYSIASMLTTRRFQLFTGPQASRRAWMVGSSTPGAILPTYMLVLFGGKAKLPPAQQRPTCSAYSLYAVLPQYVVTLKIE